MSKKKIGLYPTGSNFCLGSEKVKIIGVKDESAFIYEERIY